MTLPGDVRALAAVAIGISANGSVRVAHVNPNPEWNSAFSTKMRLQKIPNVYRAFGSRHAWCARSALRGKRNNYVTRRRLIRETREKRDDRAHVRRILNRIRSFTGKFRFGGKTNLKIPIKRGTRVVIRPVARDRTEREHSISNKVATIWTFAEELSTHLPSEFNTFFFFCQSFSNFTS